MSENKKFRIQNGVDIRGEMSFGDQVVVDDSLNITGKTITADTFEGDGSNLTGVVKPSDLNTLIDSDYIQERVVLDGVGIDSADAQLLIDVEKNRAQSAEQVNATAIQSNTNAIDAERQARIEGDQLAVNGRTVQFATLEAMISAEETRATVAEAGLSQDIVDSTSLSLSGDSDLQSQINSIKAGDTEFTGDLIPDQDNVHSLGSETKMWKDVYVGPGSLYINGQKVIEDNSGTITVNADPGQNLSLNTSGGGAIDLNSGDESVQIRSDLIISSSKTISTAGGAATKFGGDVDMQSNQIGNLGTPLQSTDAATKQYVDSVIAVPHTGTKTFDDDVVIGGTLTVKGSTTTIESETLSVADNMVDLNSNMTSGTPTENAGIRVLRGDESPKSFLWKESQGTWSAEGPITATTYYGDGSNLVGIDVYTDADVTALVDSDYVQSRVVIPESGTDSAEVISLIPTQIEAYNSANNVHFSGTNVGIGTNSPATTLDVEGNITLSGSNGKIYLPQTPNNFNWIGDVIEQTGIVIVPTNDDTSERITFAVNNSEAMRIDASGRVGIGTASPSANLDVIDPVSGNFDGKIHIGGNGSNRRLILEQTDVVTYTIGGTGTNSVTRFVSGGSAGTGTERMRIDASGHVGIGVTSPFFTTSGRTSLSVNGSTSSILAFGKGGSSENYILADAGGLTIANTSTTLPTIFFNNDSERMRIDASGNVGIGSATANNFSTTGTTNVLGVKSTSGGLISIAATGTNFSGVDLGTDSIRRGGVYSLDGSNLAFYTNATNSGTALTERMRIDASGNVGIGQSPDSGWGSNWKTLQVTSLSAHFASTSSNTYSGLTHGGYYDGTQWRYNATDVGATLIQSVGSTSPSMQFYVANSGTADSVITWTESMRITSNGNVGIGTPTTSAGKLTVEGTVVSQNAAQGSGNLQIQGYGATSYINHSGTGSLIFRMGTDFAEKMRIDASGHVGIGTSSPTHALTVSDESGGGAVARRITIKSQTHGPNSGFRFDSESSNGTARAGGYYFQPGDTSATTYLGLTATDNDYQMVITREGNVGIGTTSSIYGTDHSYLSLKGRTGDYAILELDGNTTSQGGEVDFGGGGVRQAAIASLPGSHLTFYTNATNSGKSVTERMRIDTSGNVGINTNSPSIYGKFAIRGGITVSAGSTSLTGTSFSTSDAANSTFWINHASATTNLVSDGPMAFFGPSGSGVAERMRIDASGNVGIGTNSPDSKLQIKGTINSSQLILGGTDNRGLKISTTNVGGQNDSGVIFDAQDTEAGGALSTLIFSTGGAEHMRISANGSVSVGNAAASETNDGDWSARLVARGTDHARIDAIQNVDGVCMTMYSHAGIGAGRVGTMSNHSIDLMTNGIPRVGVDLSGNMSVTGTITESSSITYKENVDPITNALELVTQLVGVTYDRKDGSAKDRAGLIAEQVNEVLPNVVKKNEEGGAEAIAYTNLIAYLIESVKELKSEIDELRGK